jgi:hypothetical protein
LSPTIPSQSAPDIKGEFQLRTLAESGVEDFEMLKTVKTRFGQKVKTGVICGNFSNTESGCVFPVKYKNMKEFVNFLAFKFTQTKTTYHGSALTFYNREVDLSLTLDCQKN